MLIFRCIFRISLVDDLQSSTIFYYDIKNIQLLSRYLISNDIDAKIDTCKKITNI